MESYWQLKGSACGDPGPPEPILPDGRSELIFNLADPLTRSEVSSELTANSRSYFVGQTLSAVSVQPQGMIHLLGVCFRSCGAYPFFSIPQKELTGQIVGLELLWGHSAADIEQKITAAKSDSERISLLDNFLLNCLETNKIYDNRAVAEAIRRIMYAEGQIRVGEMADSLGISRRRLEKKFALTVGISPKSLARITRFQKIFRIIDNCDNLDWANAIVECGYFDQSHMIRDFQLFCGKSPTQYFEKNHNLAANFRSDKRGAHFYNTI